MMNHSHISLPFRLCRFILFCLLCILTWQSARGEAKDTIPQEKAYLHFDNTGYFVGESMHFKAYVVNTCGGHLSDASRVLYVELLSPDAKIMEFQPILLEEGQGEGELRLDSLLTSGFYEVRAYTHYMADWGTEACFSRVFPIYDRIQRKGNYDNKNIRGTIVRNRAPMKSNTGKKGRKSNDNPLKIAFYPEGGHYVKGLNNRVAFTVCDDCGKPISTEVQLHDKRHRVLETLKTDGDGRGVCALKAEGSYSLCIPKSSHYPNQEVSLPNPEPTGCVLQVNAVENDTMLQVCMSVTENLSTRPFELTLQHEGIVKFQNTYTIGKQTQTVFLSKSELPEGVNLLTITDADGRIWAERMFFVMPRDSAEGRISILSQPNDLTPNGTVTLKLKAKPNASFSLSVMDAAAMPSRRNQNIRVWKLLSSELRGYVAHPQTYMESDDSAHRAATDRLMMVQGWRCNDWAMPRTETSSHTFCIPPVPRPYEYEELRDNGGVQIAEHTGKSVFFYDIMRLNRTLQSRGKSFPILLNWLDDVNPYFEGDWNTLYASFPREPWLSFSRFKVDFGSDYRRGKKLTNEELGIWTFGPSYKRGPIVWFLNGRFLYITSSKAKIDWDDSEPFERVSKTARIPYLTEYVRSVEIVERDEDFLRYLPHVRKWRDSVPTLIFITTTHHGVWEEDSKMLESLYSNRLSTFQAKDDASTPPQPYEFRRTLLWNPNVQTDAEGNAQVEFLNNSTCTKLLISAEGIASDGTPLCNE